MQPFRRNVDHFYDVGYQMTLDLRRRAEQHFRRQEQEKTQLTTVEAFETHRTRMRENFLEAIGGLPGSMEPAERTALNAEVTGRLERESFIVEKVIYQSLPEFRVSAACYVPRVLNGPAPAVVMVHGHADNGKSYDTYQKVAIDLVTNGFIVLAIDPVGQGERHQFIENGRRLHGPCTYEHTHSGLPFWLRGASIARHFVWDIMRGIDYLEARPEVDASRIAITGNSGGGTQTCYAMMCEPRLAAAVPCTFVMSLESYQKTGQPQDAEQIIPGCMKQGPGHDDYLTAIAPRPVLVGVAAYDFFPIEGAQQSVERAREIYRLYGKEENIAMAVAPTRHQYSPQLRQACVNWLKQHLRNEAPDFVTGDPLVGEESDLWTTRSGHVYVDYPSTRTALELNQAELPSKREATSPETMRQALSQALGIPAAGDRSTPIHARIIGEEVVDGYCTEKLFFFSAPDIVVTGILVHPRESAAGKALPATVLLLEHGTSDIAKLRFKIEPLLRAGRRVFVFDVRGVGALTEYSNTPELEFEQFNIEYKLGCDAMMLGLSTLGLRVFDVLRAFDYLKTRGDVSKIHLHGIESGAVFAFFAGVLEECFASLTCEEMLISYRDLCNTRDYQRQIFNLKVTAFGLLRCGDIADFCAAVAPRPLHFIHPRNALGEVLDEQHALGLMDIGVGETQYWHPQFS